GHIGFRLDHLLYPESQVSHGDLFFDVIVNAVDPLELKPGEMQYGLPHGLAGNGSGVDAGAAHDLALFNHGHAPATFRALNGGPLARRSGTDDDEIVITHKSCRGAVWRVAGASLPGSCSLQLPASQRRHKRRKSCFA